MNNKRVDPWYVLEAGDYAEAIRLYQEQHKETNAEQPLIGMAIVHLCDHNPTAAAKILDELPPHQYVSTTEFALNGVAHWLSGLPEESVALWQRGLDAQYADAAGGMDMPLLLYYACVRKPNCFARADAEKLIRKALTHPWSKCWPGAIGNFLVGRIDEERLRKEAMFRQPLVAARQTGRAEFYIGLKALENGDASTFLNKMKESANARGWQTITEAFLARYEIEQSAQ